MSPSSDAQDTSGYGNARSLAIFVRSLGDAANTSAPRTNDFTDEQVKIQQSLALSCAALSIVAGFVSFYWFIRMKATFRHRLIILLLASDTFKAIWFFVFPVVSFTTGMVRSNSTFCHASGFLLAFSIEASDYAILVIAVHTALAIFSPKASISENGLYPYRRILYMSFIAFPTLMASLAFIDDKAPYMTTGTYCYLPVRPFWYRLALSWIPRYLILFSIVALYVAIYLFVRYKFRSFSSESAGSSSYAKRTEDRPTNHRSSNLLEPEGNRSGTMTMLGTSTPFMSQRTAVSQPQQVEARNEFPVPRWEGYTFRATAPVAQMTENDRANITRQVPHPPGRKMSGDSRHTETSAENAQDITLPPQENEPPIPQVDSSMPSYNTKVQDIHVPPHTLESGPPTPHNNALALVDSKDQPIETSGLRARHKAIKRQLRFLFIYPVVYLVLWIVPFVQHCLSYDDSYVRHPSFALACVSTSILSLQALVDSILFCSRETPWRHQRPPGEQRNSWKFFLPFNRSRAHTIGSASMDGYNESTPTLKHPFQYFSSLRCKDIVGEDTIGGKSKGESVAEARVAKARRDAEKMVAREEADKQSYRRKMSLARRGGQDRSWWEVEGQKRKDSVLLGTLVTDYDSDRSASPRSKSNAFVQAIGGGLEEEDEEESAEMQSPELVARMDWPLPPQSAQSHQRHPSAPLIPPLPPLPAMVRYGSRPVRDSEESLGPMDERWSTEMRRIPGRISGEDPVRPHIRQSKSSG